MFVFCWGLHCSKLLVATVAATVYQNGCFENRFFFFLFLFLFPFLLKAFVRVPLLQEHLQVWAF